MTFEYFPSGVCSMKINIDVDEETKIVNEIKFIGGCAGNTQGVASLVKGMHIDEVISRLKGKRNILSRSIIKSIRRTK